MDWFTLFGVPSARPPQRVPFVGLGGIARSHVVREVSEPDGAVTDAGAQGRHETSDVVSLFRHYFSQKASRRLNRLRIFQRITPPVHCLPSIVSQLSIRFRH